MLTGVPCSCQFFPVRSEKGIHKSNCKVGGLKAPNPCNLPMPPQPKTIPAQSLRGLFPSGVFGDGPDETARIIINDITYTLSVDEDGLCHL